MKPEEIRLRTFETVRKGFNPAEVQRFQEAVADDFLELLKHTAELERRCAELVEKEQGAAQFEEQKKAAAEWRDMVLADLARKRAGLKVEIARLRAGRDVLKQALEEAVGVLEAPITRLDAALRDARLQGDSRAERARSERLPTAEEMRAELEAASLADFVSNPSEEAPSLREAPAMTPAPTPFFRALSPREVPSPLDEPGHAPAEPPKAGESSSSRSLPPQSASSPSSLSPADLPPGADELEKASTSQELDEIFTRARAEQEG